MVMEQSSKASDCAFPPPTCVKTGKIKKKKKKKTTKKPPQHCDSVGWGGGRDNIDWQESLKGGRAHSARGRGSAWAPSP